MSIIAQYQKYTKLPLGNWMFNKVIGFSAPFFGKLKPNVTQYSAGHCEVRIKDRWGIRNHIGTINAGALCSVAELTGGLALDSVVAKNLRWLPKGMTVSYIKKAVGPQTCICKIGDAVTESGEVNVPLVVVDSDNDTVFSADINFYISHKPS